MSKEINIAATQTGVGFCPSCCFSIGALGNNLNLFYLRDSLTVVAQFVGERAATNHASCSAAGTPPEPRCISQCGTKPLIGYIGP